MQTFSELMSGVSGTMGSLPDSSAVMLSDGIRPPSCVRSDGTELATWPCERELSSLHSQPQPASMRLRESGQR